jgi:hypothetical protein
MNSIRTTGIVWFNGTAVPEGERLLVGDLVLQCLDVVVEAGGPLIVGISNLGAHEGSSLKPRENASSRQTSPRIKPSSTVCSL